MSMLVLNLLLALAWLLLTGQFTPTNFLFGLVVAYGVLWLFWRATLPRDGALNEEHETPLYFRKVTQSISFALFFLWELILANLRVALDVLRPQMRFEPAVVAVPLQGYSDAEASLLANFITLTPGTLSLDIVDEPQPDNPEASTRTLYIHAMHAGQTQAAIDRFRDQVQRSFARRVQEVMR